MATMDIIKLNGGQPANFLDVGGGATPAAIKQAFDLITSDPKVTAIFVNIFGGIVRCDAIAQGLISVVESMNLRTPIVARLQGTNMEKAHKLVGFLLYHPWFGIKSSADDDTDQRVRAEDFLDRRSAKCGREVGAILEGGENGYVIPQHHPHSCTSTNRQQREISMWASSFH